VDIRLVDVEVDGLGQRGAGELNVAFDECIRLFGGSEVPFQLELVVADEGLGCRGDIYVAGDAPVVPPVGVDGGDLVGVTGVVGFYDEGVVAFPELVGDLELEWREAALVCAELFAVEIDMRLVVDGAEVKEVALMGVFRQLEDAAVPDGTFVIQEFVVLGVPVARDLECRAAIEIVFDELAFVGLFLSSKKPPVPDADWS